MSRSRRASRETVTDYLRPQNDNNQDEASSLILVHTRSHDLGGAESVAVQEDVPGELDSDTDDDESDASKPVWPPNVHYLVLLCGFLTSLSFSVTQVPLLYVFRLMTCDAYYENHPSPTGDLATESLWSTLMSHASRSLLLESISHMSQDKTDRCSIHAIESSTALSVSLLGASTTVFGIMNLFLTGSLIKRIGVKRTLLIQVFFPALRLLVQNIGVEVWGNTGIIIIQCSQMVSIIGGPSGYMLVLNTFITEIVEYEGRTAALGQLAGSLLFGMASGILLGGIMADVYGIKAPFRLTLALFLLSCLYVAVCLPYVPPAKKKDANKASAEGKKSSMGVKSFLGPLVVFAPQQFVLLDGNIQTNSGALLLACGVFLGILATGYLPTLLQMYSTDVFQFGTRENGYLICLYSLLRGVFLTFAFPRLIALGRKYTAKREERRRHQERHSDEPEREPLISSNSGSEHDVAKETKKQQTFTFDLTYTRVSLISDGLLTLLCSFVREGWQMYLVAAVLPFAAGTGSAAKGTVLQMIGSSASSSDRTDALAGISLVENMARLSTTFIFGVIFAAFASIGHTELVFVCNAGAALIGFIVLLFARFPPDGSRKLEKEDEVSDVDS